MKRWIETTTIHGPSHVVDSKTPRPLRFFWFLVTLVALIGTVGLTLTLFRAYFRGDIRSSTDALDKLETVRITYCGNDWVDVEKVQASGLSNDTFAYFLSLLPGMYNGYDLVLHPDYDQVVVTGINQFYDEMGQDPNVDGSRLRVHEMDWNGRDPPRTGYLAYYGRTVDELAAEIASYAKNHSLSTLVSFASHFARETVALRSTREVGRAIYFGRLCRELEADEASGQNNYRINRNVINFYVQYDFNYGTEFIGDDTTMLKGYAHRVAVLPYVGGMKASTYLTQQRMFGANAFVNPLVSFSPEKYYELIDESSMEEASSFAASIRGIAGRNVVVARFEQTSTKLQSKPNAGNAPCEHRDGTHQLPVMYPEYECLDKCQEQASRERLRIEYECDFVGSETELAGLTNPCSCLRFNTTSAILPSSTRFGLCGTMVSSCAEKCTTVLPLCESYSTKLTAKGDTELITASVHSAEHPGEYPTDGRMLINIQMTINDVTRVKEYLAVTASDLVVSLGGTAGFFMGISVLSLVHVITSVVEAVAGLGRRNKVN